MWSFTACLALGWCGGPFPSAKTSERKRSGVVAGSPPGEVEGLPLLLRLEHQRPQGELLLARQRLRRSGCRHVPPATSSRPWGSSSVYVTPRSRISLTGRIEQSSMHFVWISTATHASEPGHWKPTERTCRCVAVLLCALRGPLRGLPDLRGLALRVVRHRVLRAPVHPLLLHRRLAGCAAQGAPARPG